MAWRRLLGLAVATLVLLAPVAWMILSSFKPNTDLYSLPVHWFPRRLTFANYAEVLSQTWFWVYLRNSAAVSAVVTVVSVAIAVLAGYSLARYRYRGHRAIMTSLLGSQMFPQILLVTPIFLIFAEVHLLDTVSGLCIAYLVLVLPFSIWMMAAYFNAIPVDLDEAGYCDGLSRFGVLWRVLLPAASPGIVAVALFSVLVSWSEFLLASILIQDDGARTLTPGMAFRFIGAYSTDWGGIMAMATLVSLPIVVLFLALQRQFVAGLTAGAVKG